GYEDTLNAFVRRGVHLLGADSLPDKAREWTKHIGAKNLREWLGALVPGLLATVPEGGRDNPVCVGVVFSETPLDAIERHRLRLAHSPAQEIAPSERDSQLDEHPSIWRPSANEICLFSSFGVQWVINPATTF